MYQRLNDIEPPQRAQLTMQLAKSKAKLPQCHKVCEDFDRLLSELQEQRDNAKGLVEETFQTYKAMLDKKRVGIALCTTLCLGLIITVECMMIVGFRIESLTYCGDKNLL